MLPVIGFVAPSGSGKTTLIRRLVPLLQTSGLRVGYLKHAHHGVDVDTPGKDSFEIRAAGATQVLLASRERWALMTECPGGGPEPDLSMLLAQFDPQLLDLVLVEGFKHEHFPKIEVFRPELGCSPLFPEDPDIIAVASPQEPSPRPAAHWLPLDDPHAIAGFLLAWRAGVREE